MANINNNNKVLDQEKGQHYSKRPDELDEIEKTLDSVPIPVAWSPGMSITPNPSLFVTPQKPFVPHKSFLTAKENILEPQSVHKIPKPVSWSPGMRAQLDPNLFITPDKDVDRKLIANVIGNGKENIIEKDNFNNQKASIKPKEAYSVRFDLPSSTSGDETSENISDSDSPITLRGCEMRTERQSFDSPIWKSFSPQKAYNPSTYSDESSLDESIMSSSLPSSKHDSSYDPLKIFNITDSNNKQDRIASKSVATIPDASKPVVTTSNASSSSHKSDFKLYKQTETKQHLEITQKRSAKSSDSKIKSHKIENSKSNIMLTSKAQNEKRRDGKSKVGADFLSSSSSPHELPTPGTTVVREMKNNLLSTEYSFPFELRTLTADAEYEHTFARPEFNSTLKVRAELDALYEQEVDVKKAVEVNLERSEIKRVELNEKAAACTNRMSSQFKNLVDLNTSVESLCDRIVRMRTNKMPSKKKAVHVEKKSTGLTKAPDLMEFFTSDLQRECPDFTLPGVTNVTSKLLTAPKDVVFDLYRHNRLWQGINDF